MKKITYILALALGIATAQAQTIDKSVIGAAAGTLSNGMVTLDVTAGDLAVTDITNGTVTLHQGFQQTRVELMIQLNPVAFLQGPGISPATGEESLMRDNLRSLGLLPLTSPYDMTVTTDASVFAVTGDNAIVDWVEVELREGVDNDNTTVVESVSALLQRDGDIVAMDGVSSIQLDIENGDYFIAINHRNHLGIITDMPVTLSNTTATTADFTADASFIKNGMIATSLLSDSGRLALFAGDVNNDLQVLSSDISTVRPQLGAASSYTTNDVNMDGQILTSDISLLISVNQGRGQQF